MACIKGSSGVVKVGVTPTAVAKVKSFNIDVAVDIGDTTNFDSGDWQENCAGVKSWSGTMDIVVEIDEAGQDLLVVGDELAAEFYQNGDTTGGKKHAGTIIVSGRNENSTTGAVVEMTVAFTGTGALVPTTVV